MAQAEVIDESVDQPEETSAPGGLEGQTYEIIRKRLAASGAELRARLEKLNDDRKEVFGSIETALLSTKRITTDNNCVPRDMVEVGRCFLFGYNVHIGLRAETVLEDVFAAYSFDGEEFHPEPLDLLRSGQFEEDFRNLYKYYKHTRFAKFSIIGPYLFLVFRVGPGVDDIKTFKWQVEGDSIRYLDNRSDHEFRYPSQHEFEWVRATRDMYRFGAHPHVSIDDRLFVETVGGDLTIKIENNTDSGEGIYSEPVDDPDQTLDDGEIYYAIIGNIIALKMRPYQEQDFRYFVYNDKIKQARRMDSIADSCVLLPDDHGLIFPKGFYLQSGQYKTFDLSAENLVFTERFRASNGEDFLFVFYNRMSGTYVLLAYNLISQEVATPMVSGGYATFEDGVMISFRHHDEPEKHHAVQVWQTPFLATEQAPTAKTDSMLYKIGNRDLVRAMAECHEVLKLVAKEDTYANLYLDLVKRTTDVADAYFWIDNDATYNLKEVLVEVRDTASKAINEFEKVVRVRRNTEQQLGRVTKETDATVNTIKTQNFDDISAFVESLAELRRLRGEIISLRDLKYADAAAIDGMEKQVEEYSDSLAQRCVEFLIQPESLVPYEQRVEAEHDKVDGLTKVADAKLVLENVSAASDELEMLIEIVSNLKIDDATQRTSIIDDISTIFSRLNQTRAALKRKSQDLASTEGAAEFHSQLKLLNQAVVNYLDVCDAPEKCEEYLTKVMIQIEEMEGRFAEFDDFVLELGEKRDEIYNAFETRRLSLVEARNRRADTLMKSAERILKGVKTRVDNMESVDEINGYFASDLMIEKVRDIVGELTELDDSVKVDDIQSKLKTIREDAVRQLKDRQELFVDGQNVIQLGRHKFSVNVQALDLTTVMHDGELSYHLTGTNFFEPITDERLLATRDVWDQEVVSENKTVYRAEYLAHLILQSLGQGEDAPSLAGIAAYDDGQLAGHVQKFMGPRYSEGYIKGVHDHDAAIYLRALVELKSSIGLLSYSSPARALAGVFWQAWSDESRKPILAARLEGFGKISQLFVDTKTQAECISELCGLIENFCDERPGFNDAIAAEAGEYLFNHLAGGHQGVISREASDIYRAFHDHLELKAYENELAASLKGVSTDAVSSFLLARDWVGAFVDECDAPDWDEYRDEVALLLLEKEFDESRVVHTPITRDLTGLLGTHSVIKGGDQRLSFNEFSTRLTHFADDVAPKFTAYTHLKRDLVDEAREELRLEEFRPRVLTSFVRNKLIDKVYLPMAGDNFAKQLGAAGDDKRTDRMGLLLLISPPGYGKTTLMEYMANRLGIIFMKVNGPAIGHQVTSLDPDEAPNAAAREEVEKLNLALEMGDNIMLYVDDIQHCNPEFLQKFISLCDATRKIEGVYKGKTRTYDLRGRKVCVVMAGNPYTESGEKFQIPDMLSNRADTYNLGEIIGDSRDVFEMSYLENSLTSNPTLSQLAARSPNDIYSVIKMAEGAGDEPIELDGNYSMDEVTEMVATMRKMIRVRDVILAVNREYIRSAGMQDDYRTEPAFKLQGSYRNMNRIAEKVSPIMNDDELQTLIVSAYEQDSQTLTTGAEANLLKFKELTGMLSDEEAERWGQIKRTFSKNLKFRGLDEGDKFGQVISQMDVFSDGLDSIRGALATGVKQLTGGSSEVERMSQVLSHLADFKSGLAAIRETMTDGMQQMGEIISQSSPQTTQPTALTATFSPEVLDALTDAIESMKAAVPAAAPAAAAALPTFAPPPTAAASEAASSLPHEIKVINKVPRVILGVVREQFNLMQGWLAPLVQSAQTQRDDMKYLKERLNVALDQYRALIAKLEDDEV
jgi:hypothetical protein